MPSLARVSTTDFVIAFWPIVGALIPEAVHHPQQCEETFSLCNTLFKKLAEISLDFLSLEDLVERWGTLLLSHACREASYSAPAESCNYADCITECWPSGEY
jgi:hypothetical protein